MADFRRWFLAFAALVLVLGLTVPASAQPGKGGITCGTTASVTPTLRHEGYTELTGDIVLTCSAVNGAQSIGYGDVVPTANITVTVGAPVTSRAFGGGAVVDALLLVDDPSPSPTDNQSVCNPATPTSCVNYGDGVGGTFNTTTRGGEPVYNIFQGIMGLGGPGLPNRVITFLGVPVDPPTTPGTYRTYRITNIRVDATGLGTGIPLYAYVTSSGPSSISIPPGDAQALIGFASMGLTQDISGNSPVVSAVSPAVSFLECFTGGQVQVGTATFTENFATAFKTRGAITTTSGTPPVTTVSGPQNTPGAIYNTESGFEIATVPGYAGYADTGTRLFITISNIPPGAVIAVDNWAGSAAGTDASLVPSSNPSPPPDPGSATITTVFDNSKGTTSGSTTVIWEVTTANPAAVVSLSFGIYASFAGQSANTPATTLTTAVGGFNPQFPTSGVLPIGGVDTVIPTFSSIVPGLPTTGPTLFTTAPCQTVLLFPYITDFTGFDTGLAISNTSLDTLSTTPQNTAGCTFTFYSGGAVAFTYDTGTIAGGATWADNLSGIELAKSITPPVVPTGYAIATCYFQYAHGYSFVSDYGLEHFAAAYLALIIPDVPSGRQAQPFSCSSIGGCPAVGPAGEQLVH